MNDRTNNHADGSARTDAARKRARSPEKTVALRKYLEFTRENAEGGDGEAMHRFGRWYQFGLHGLPQDAAQARAWYERSAAVRYPEGIAAFGECLLLGDGGPKEIVRGMVNVTEAAHLRSELGAYLLGWAFFNGHFRYGLRRDPARARSWLKRVVGGRWKFKSKSLSDAEKANAARWLRELSTRAYQEQVKQEANRPLPSLLL